MLLDLRNSRLVAASGVSRLNLYKLQEADLLKREARRAAEEAIKQQETKKDEQVERQAAPQRTRKAAPRAVPVVEYPEVRLKRKPIYTSPQPVYEQLPVWLSFISLEIERLFATFIPVWPQVCQTVTITKRAAANDADYRLRLLLLAA